MLSKRDLTLRSFTGQHPHQMNDHYVVRYHERPSAVHLNITAESFIAGVFVKSNFVPLVTSSIETACATDLRTQKASCKTVTRKFRECLPGKNKRAVLALSLTGGKFYSIDCSVLEIPTDVVCGSFSLDEKLPSLVLA